MFKRTILTLLFLLLVLGGIFGGRYYLEYRQAQQAGQFAWPPTTISTATAEAARWDARTSTLATLEALEGTTITAQIAGNVLDIAFESGAAVRRGALLVRLDDSTQRAQLEADRSRLKLAATSLKRLRQLQKANAASQSDLDAAEAEERAAAAAVESGKATLDKLNIRAPFSGLLGIRKVSAGQYVAPGTPIVELQRQDPLLLNFSLPQERLGEISTGREVAFTVDAWKGEVFRGTITALDSRIDPQTRNIGIQATVRNADGRLRPGMFGQAGLSVGAPLDGVEVPASAIAYSTAGDSVFVVRGAGGGGNAADADADADASAQAEAAQAGTAQTLSAHLRIVQVREERDGRVLVDSGLEAGDVVVTAGQHKLRDGAPVAVNNDVRP